MKSLCESVDWRGVSVSTSGITNNSERLITMIVTRAAGNDIELQ